MHEYPAARMAREAYGDRYGAYIQASMSEHVSKGHYSHDYAMSVNLGQILAGNDGE